MTTHITERTTLDYGPDRRVKRSDRLDTFRRYITDGLTPSDLSNILKNIDQGDIAAMCEIAEGIESKDAHIQGVVNTRRQGITALEWEIVPETRTEDTALAEEAAAFVEDELVHLRSFPDTLNHLANAIICGVAVTELIWNRGRLVETNDVPGHRLVGDLFTGQGVFVETDQIFEGIPLNPGKFVVFTPNPRAGFPLRVTLTRALAYCFIVKHCAMADWASFSEVFGMPVRVAKFQPGATPGEQDKVQEMLENMGSDLWAMFSDQVDVTLLEGARGTQPYQPLIEMIDAKISILVLGQTLTTEQGNVGSLALGRVHDNVRASLALSDMANEARMVQEQIIDPMVRIRWPGKKIPLPRFKRRIIESRNLDADRVTMDQIRLAREAGLPIDQAVLYEKLNIPQPKEDLTAPDAGLNTP